MQELPTSGTTVGAMSVRFEIVDLAGRRIDRVVAGKANAPTENA